ncbi:MAG TPA: NAD(P)/FAD-dependent oxidoreductase, partial [Ilumatobacteraceae bacterium]
LGLGMPAAPTVGDMIVVGPSGRQVVLPARAGRTYPGHAIVVPRAQFDAQLRKAAFDAGAVAVEARVGSVDGGRVGLDGYGLVDADFVIGADGATSLTARTTGLADPSRALWGFAVRGYVPVDVGTPVISLWNDQPGRAFPGYGWLFPGPDGANLGQGLGLGHSRLDSRRAQQELDAFCAHLVRIGMLEWPPISPTRQLGGWLKMGLVGTRPAAGSVLLVGDAAGLVNPLQGEGISQALASGQAAALAILEHPATAAESYRRWVDATYGRWASVTAPVHSMLVHHPRQVSGLGAAITGPFLGSLIASTWAIYWNDLTDGAVRTPAVATAKAIHRVGRAATIGSRVRRSLRSDLA